MNKKRHLLVLDPTAFAGGSKIATENILRLLNTDKVRITVLTAHKDSWSYAGLKAVQLFQPKWLSKKEMGILYFLRHTIIAINVLFTRIRFGSIDDTLGASGPGVDLALYLIQPLLHFKIAQLIHGPVAASKTIARGLNKANVVYYLESTKYSLLATLSRLTHDPKETLPSHFHIMLNGLPTQSWPTRCQNKKPVIFWAASLLKWKGLDILSEALLSIPLIDRPDTHICYISPKDTLLPVSKVPFNTHAVHCHENPENLDQLRAEASIFVSTSQSEPFGLSILEAMAAGHCALIPKDGAYWDKTLEDGINCIKYIANDANDLAEKLLFLSRDMKTINRIGDSAAQIALEYQAEKQYANIKYTLDGEKVASC